MSRAVATTAAMRPERVADALSKRTRTSKTASALCGVTSKKTARSREGPSGRLSKNFFVSPFTSASATRRTSHVPEVHVADSISMSTHARSVVGHGVSIALTRGQSRTSRTALATHTCGRPISPISPDMERSVRP
jgi:hypothetical protein